MLSPPLATCADLLFLEIETCLVRFRERHRGWDGRGKKRIRAFNTPGILLLKPETGAVKSTSLSISHCKLSVPAQLHRAQPSSPALQAWRQKMKADLYGWHHP